MSKRRKNTALNMMKQQRRVARYQEKVNKLCIEREKKSIELIKHWINFSLEEASQDPHVYMTEESITLMSGLNDSPEFHQLIESLKNDGFDVRYTFGSGHKNRPILTIILSWEHHLKQATKAINSESDTDSNIIEPIKT